MITTISNDKSLKKSFTFSHHFSFQTPCVPPPSTNNSHPCSKFLPHCPRHRHCPENPFVDWFTPWPRCPAGCPPWDEWTIYRSTPHLPTKAYIFHCSAVALWTDLLCAKFLTRIRLSGELLKHKDTLIDIQ